MRFQELLRLCCDIIIDNHIYINIYIYIYIYLYIYRYLYPYPSLSLIYIHVSIYLYKHLSIYLSISLYISLSLFISLSSITRCRRETHICASKLRQHWLKVVHRKIQHNQSLNKYSIINGRNIKYNRIQTDQYIIDIYFDITCSLTAGNWGKVRYMDMIHEYQL